VVVPPSFAASVAAATRPAGYALVCPAAGLRQPGINSSQ